MPFSVRTNEQSRTVTLVCWGVIRVEDLMEYERRFWGGTEHEGFHHIVDLQVADMQIGLDEGLMLATHATPVDLKAYSGARSAIVVGNDEQYILAEAYREARHLMCNPAIREVQVFTDMEAAKDWIQAPVTEVSFQT